MINPYQPLYVQRRQCIKVSKASGLNFQNIIGKTSTKKEWTTTFNPHKVNEILKQQFDIISQMIVMLESGKYNDVVYLLYESCFKKEFFVRKITSHKESCQQNAILRNKENIMQRLIIIRCVLDAYLNSNTPN